MENNFYNSKVLKALFGVHFRSCFFTFKSTDYFYYIGRQTDRQLVMAKTTTTEKQCFSFKLFCFSVSLSYSKATEDP